MGNVAVLVVGTDEDPQDLASQVAAFEEAGAAVFDNLTSMVDHVVDQLGQEPPAALPPVSLEVLDAPVAALTFGVETFAFSLAEQGARAVHVDWRPPAGGDDRLLSVLDRLRR